MALRFAPVKFCLEKSVFGGTRYVDLVNRLSHSCRMKAVNVHEAKTHFSRLLDRAHGGEEILIAKGGVPYARLVPLATQPARREAGTLKHKIAIDASFYDPLPAAWSGEE